jgi:hypothetical protein
MSQSYSVYMMPVDTDTGEENLLKTSSRSASQEIPHLL